MSKPNNKPARRSAASSLDWNAEGARMEAAAKEKAGDRGNKLMKVRAFIGQDTPAAKLLRDAAGDAGAQAFIEQPRNVLAKLPRLATCLVAGTPWCSAEGMGVDGRRKEDASVAASLAAIISTDGMSERQKGIIAMCNARYPGGANAQMPAAMEALAFVGIVERQQGATRNVPYVVVDEARARSLIPSA